MMNVKTININFQVSAKTLLIGREKKGKMKPLKNWREETRNNVYQSSVSANVFSTEQIIIEKFDKIKEFQQEARKARLENVQLLEKYARRVAAKNPKPKTAGSNLK